MANEKSLDRPGYERFWAVAIDKESKVVGHWAYREIRTYPKNNSAK